MYFTFFISIEATIHFVLENVHVASLTNDNPNGLRPNHLWLLKQTFFTEYLINRVKRAGPGDECRGFSEEEFREK